MCVCVFELCLFLITCLYSVSINVLIESKIHLMVTNNSTNIPAAYNQITNYQWFLICFHSGVTRWVSPGVATEGVAPIFPEKTDDHFSHQRLPVVLRCHPFSLKLTTFFCSSLSIIVTFIDFTRVSPHEGCHPTPFLPLRPRLSTILCKFSHKIFFRSGVTPWRVRPPSDATVFSSWTLLHCVPLKILEASAWQTSVWTAWRLGGWTPPPHPANPSTS